MICSKPTPSPKPSNCRSLWGSCAAPAATSPGGSWPWTLTYYNAPNAGAWKSHFENLPQRLQTEGVDPRVPWLYKFKLDFRFK